MAVFPDLNGSVSTHPTATAAAASNPSSSIDIQAWTVSAMESVDISPLVSGAGITIPVEQAPAEGEPAAAPKPLKVTRTITLPYRHPATAVVGRTKSWQKEEPTRPGNRHRRRWENANLVGVPNVQPPQPIDFIVRPSYPVRHIPYQLASLWDQRLRQQAEEVASKRLSAQKRIDRARGAASGTGRGEVPRGLRDAIKRSSTTWAWVQALEEIIRTFLSRQAEGWEHVEDSDSDGMDGIDEGEMVVVVAEDKVRGSRAADGKLVFDDLGDGESGTYKRWLAHAIADYYGLSSRSLTVGKGARSKRVVQIEGSAKAPPSPVLLPMRSSTSSISAFLPRPLSEICQGRS